LKQFFERHNILDGSNNNKKYDKKKCIYIPCNYDNTDKEISEMEKKPNSYYMIINKCDIFVGKNYLWNFLYMFYGDNALKLVPKTYVTYDVDSMNKFKLEYNKDKLYIMKKNVQRQEGIKITKNYDELLKGIEDEYVVIQELLQNPFLVNGRKINLRVYVLLTIKDNKCSTYIYNNGFMYYTSNTFIKGSAELDRNITTGYIDRKVYEENPLTHTDFKTFLGKEKSDIIFNNISKLIGEVMIPYHSHLVENQGFPGSMQFQIFGSDIAINDDYTAMLMEINKGPDLNYKDKRDGEVKRNLIEDIFNLVGITESDGDNGFIKVG
jgi:tubulin polyglutamylase TTLL7